MERADLSAPLKAATSRRTPNLSPASRASLHYSLTVNIGLVSFVLIGFVFV